MKLDALHQGDCLEVLPTIPAESVDSVVTDPPAGISFMGQKWDGPRGGRKQWISWLRGVMAECLRVLKPGGHALVWALPRTSHWTATAIEDAGFEVRDIVTHIFGSGFPKSSDLSKNIDKMAGAEREIYAVQERNKKKGESKIAQADKADRFVYSHPATPEAKKWDGWGTSLKPSNEHWILARKPIEEKSIASNVLKHGTGGINIDGCRIPHRDDLDLAESEKKNQHTIFTNPGSNLDSYSGSMPPREDYNGAAGRFPSNLVLSHHPDCESECVDGCPVKELDRQSGLSQSRNSGPRSGKVGGGFGMTRSGSEYEDDGGASRFFYCAKPSRGERNKGTEWLDKKPGGSTVKGFTEDQARGVDRNRPTGNFHPTVKATSLMRYLCRMITPPGGTVLDPFMGSGSTAVAADQEQFEFIGIEKDPEYYEIAKARIKSEMPLFKQEDT